MAMTITSPVFRHEGAIPARYTCEGDDVSPPLMLGGVPPAAKSLALIVDDPDAPDPAAPKRVWVHWVIYNLPPTTKELPERASARTTGEMPDTAGLVHRSDGTAISTSCTRSIPCWRISINRTKQRSRKQCRAISSARRR